MKFVVVATSLALWAACSVTTAFVPPSAVTRTARTITTFTTRGETIVRYAGPEEEDEKGSLDLDLSEMFEL
jgi:hypothetical protein